MEDLAMRKIAVLLLTVAFVWSSVAVVLRAEESSEKENGELAEALESVKVSLDDGLQASEAQGTPISGKFEMEDGKLQLSVYTMKDGKFFEVIVDHKTGKVAKAEPITGGDDLTAAKAQVEAMAEAKSSLHILANKALADNSGSQAVSITPSLKEGHPVAEVVLVKNDHFNKISSPLD
jgi:hypothetical protein